VRAIQHTQFCAKNVKNDLNPIELVKRNFCFETEGVLSKAGFGIMGVQDDGSVHCMLSNVLLASFPFINVHP
jgi:hypothetical protein